MLGKPHVGIAESPTGGKGVGVRIASPLILRRESNAPALSACHPILIFFAAKMPAVPLLDR